MAFIVDLLHLTFSAFEPYWFYAFMLNLVALVMTGFTPAVASPVMTETEHHMVFTRRVLYFAFFILLGWLSLAVTSAAAASSLRFALGAIGRSFGRWWWGIAGAFFGAWLFRLVHTRYGGPFWSRLWRTLRVGQPAEKLSDMRDELHRQFTSDYDPRSYYQPGKVFSGRDEAGKPVYLAEAEWYDTHHMVVGATRFGKGKTFQVWADQAIRRGDCVIMIDPKGDKFLPGIIEAAALAASRKFIMLDLGNDEAPGAYSPFVGGTPLDRRARFFTVMEMDERGTDADHYKALARSLAMPLFRDTESPKIRTLLQQLTTIRDRDEDAGKPLSTVIARLQEWSEYDKLNPPKRPGFSVEQSLQNNAVVYVRSSLDNAVLKAATRALLIEILQESKRLENQRTARVSLFVDELRFLVSKPVTDGLATIAGAGVNMSVAFQNLGDLLAPDDIRLDGNSIQQSVTVNCQIKVVFGGTDFQTAEYVAEASGTIVKTVRKYEGVETNIAGGEKWDGNRMLGDQEEAVITANKVLSLQPFVGVLLRPRQLATLVSIAHIAYTPKPVPVMATTPAPPSSSVTATKQPPKSQPAVQPPAVVKSVTIVPPTATPAPVIIPPAAEPALISHDDEMPSWAYAQNDSSAAPIPESNTAAPQPKRRKNKPKAVAGAAPAASGAAAE